MYFGFPSAEMKDVIVWQGLLKRVVAIERDRDIATSIAMTAESIGLRDKTVIIRRDLLEVSEWLSLDPSHRSAAISSLTPSLQSNINLISKDHFDIIYLDMYGGFVYLDDQGNSSNVNILNNLLRYQEQFRKPFYILVTYNLRDTGAGEYRRFVADTLSQLADNQNIKPDNLEKVKSFYQSEENDTIPASLRRIRFSLPIFLMNSARHSYEISEFKSWYYVSSNHFFHASLRFTPRDRRSPLGSTWPHLDEIRLLINEPIIKLSTENGTTVEHIIETPTL